MKRILALMIIPLAASAANVTFDLHDFTTVGITNRLTQITPTSTPFQNGATVISSDRRYYYTDTNGVFAVTNMLVGCYRVELLGPFARTLFKICIPTTNGVIDASDYIEGTGIGILAEDGQPIIAD